MLRAARARLVHRCSTRSIAHFPLFVQNELREAADGGPRLPLLHRQVRAARRLVRACPKCPWSGSPSRRFRRQADHLRVLPGEPAGNQIVIILSSRPLLCSPVVVRSERSSQAGQNTEALGCEACTAEVDYQAEAGKASCLSSACEAGKYQDLEGNTTCKPCPGGCAMAQLSNPRVWMRCACTAGGVL